MPEFHETRIVPFPAVLLYDVVADVERYPEFLPGCRALRILTRTTTDEGDVLQAEMTAGAGPWKERYISRVLLQPDICRITVTQSAGPFRHLDNRWSFRDTPQGAEVSFFIAFAFRNPLFAAAMNGVFSQSVQQMSRAFEARAAALSRV